MLVLVEIINPGYYNNILTLEKLERRPVLLSNILCPRRLRLCCVILLDLSRCIDYDANLRQVCKTLLQIFLDLGHFFLVAKTLFRESSRLFSIVVTINTFMYTSSTFSKYII